MQRAIDRRQFLHDLGAASIGGCLLGGLSCASASAGRREVRVAGRRVRTFDIHGHCQIGEVVDLVAESGLDHPDVRLWTRLRQSPLWSRLDLDNVENRLAAMDEHGIDVQAISNAFWYWPPYELAREINSAVNEGIAGFCERNPDRFVGLGSLSMQFPELAVEQLVYGVRELGLKGFMIAGSVNGKELSSAEFHPLWAKAEELGSLVFLHPNGFSDGESRFEGNGNLGNVIGNPLETTVALSHLIFEGTLDRFPGLKICVAHGGGYLPFYSGRSDHCVTHFPQRCKPVEQFPSEYLRRIWFDSLVYTPSALRYLVDQVGVDRIVLGTDFPATMGNLAGAVDHILETPDLSDNERAAILGDNARALLGIDPAS